MLFELFIYKICHAQFTHTGVCLNEPIGDGVNEDSNHFASFAVRQVDRQVEWLQWKLMKLYKAVSYTHM